MSAGPTRSLETREIAETQAAITVT